MMVLPLPLSRQAIASAIGLALFAVSLAAPRPAAAQLGAFGTDQRYCDRSALQKILSTSTGNLLGSAAGGAIGGLLGSNIGKGSGNTLATIVGVLGGALAGGYIGRSMDPADQACVNQALEHTPTNQTIAWQNPDNGSSYWVTPTQSYQGSGGEPCRDYVTDALVGGQRQEMHGTACRQPDGSWKTASGGSAATAPAPAAAIPASLPAAPRAPTGGALSTDTILQVQQRLHDTGFYVRDNIDGVWGPHTAAALKNFQRAHGLTASGQLDPQTIAALDLPKPPQ